VWCKYTETPHSPTDQSRPCAKFYSGPEGKKLPDGVNKVDPITLVKELEIEFVVDWRIAAYSLWKARYGEAQPTEIAKKVENANEKRKRGDDDHTTPRKEAYSDENPTQSADPGDKIQSAIDACHMSEEEVLRAFNDYDQPVSEFVLHHVQGIAMRVVKTKVVPPMTLLHKIRATGTYIIPWYHSAWQVWEKSVKSSDEPEKVEPEKAKSSKRKKVESSEREKVESSKREKEHAIGTETVSAQKAAHRTHAEYYRFLKRLDKWFLALT
jgi:hypothetical protein